MSAVDVFATEGCPVGKFCESCGDTGPSLTLCARCDAGGMTRQIPAGTAAVFVGTHCGHLGITVDDMAEVLAGEDR